MSRSVHHKSNSRIKQRISSAPATQLLAIINVDDAVPPDLQSTAPTSTAMVDSEEHAKGDISPEYFAAQLKDLGFRLKLGPSEYWHDSYHSVWLSNTLATRRSQLAYLRSLRAEWVVEAGQEPEREYPYLSREGTMVAGEPLLVEDWFLHWLQPWMDGSRVRRSDGLASVIACPTEAAAIRLFHCLDEAEPGWEKGIRLNAAIVSGLAP